jgi:hypothetical protein
VSGVLVVCGVLVRLVVPRVHRNGMCGRGRGRRLMMGVVLVVLVVHEVLDRVRPRISSRRMH